MRNIVFLFISALSVVGRPRAVSAEESIADAHKISALRSLIPISDEDILVKKRIWRDIYLEEKQNKPFFAHKKEITKYIIEGVKEGLLTPYQDENFSKPMSKEAFFDNLKLPEDSGTAEEQDTLGLADDDWGDNDGKEKKTIEEPSEIAHFLPKEVAILELMEDWIFDKTRSQQIYEIKSIKLIISEDKFETGLRKEVGIFRYKDLATYLDDKEALWINTQNSAANVKMTEAISLRLFSSRITKLENPNDNTIADIYDKTPKAAIIASKELEEKLLEEEYFLWKP